jgi:hypothetical protein
LFHNLLKRLNHYILYHNGLNLAECGGLPAGRK